MVKLCKIKNNNKVINCLIKYIILYNLNIFYLHNFITLLSILCNSQQWDITLTVIIQLVNRNVATTTDLALKTIMLTANYIIHTIQVVTITMILIIHQVVVQAQVVAQLLAMLLQVLYLSSFWLYLFTLREEMEQITTLR